MNQMVSKMKSNSPVLFSLVRQIFLLKYDIPLSNFPPFFPFVFLQLPNCSFSSSMALCCLGADHLLLSIAILIFILLPLAESITFNFTKFDLTNANNITYVRDAIPVGDVIELTNNRLNVNITNSLGRAFYNRPVQLWDPANRQLTDFTAHFSFQIRVVSSFGGDGLAFFIAANGSQIPANSGGGSLGLFNSSYSSNSTFGNPTVAVEFDSYWNRQFDPSDNHIGIDVNSIVSVTNVSWNSSIKDGRVANAWVRYNASTMNLTVFLSYAENPTFNGSSSLHHIVDLREILPEVVYVGFSAATGSAAEIHNILSWDFSSTLEVKTDLNTSTPPNPGNGVDNTGNSDGKTKIVVGVVVGIGGFVGIFVVGWFFLWRKRSKGYEEEENVDLSMDDEFEKGTGPKRFTYKELANATNDFSENGKLGEGGFGGIYRGYLRDLNLDVAVKRVSRTSKQGKKEYVSEVKIISRLRHRNLVQLIGWSHERGEFLLVYELMPNGSLDSHLFGRKNLVLWETRNKIALGLASALLYLHEEWEQCVVHRDIKSSNVMLDSGFNAKLGDFGLARLVDHELGSQTTVLAGTMGYLAPECVTTGKASKESDVYSFGIVALEIACGRKPVEPKAEPSKVRMVEWVWDLYGKGSLLEAVDERLGKDYEEEQIERLMIIGLWCAHPDFNFRPSMRQVISVLKSEAPLPNLPSKLPVPTYFPQPMQSYPFTYSSTSSGLTNSEGGQTQTSSSASTTGSSMSVKSSASTYLLQSHPR